MLKKSLRQCRGLFRCERHLVPWENDLQKLSRRLFVWALFRLRLATAHPSKLTPNALPTGLFQ